MTSTSGQLRLMILEAVDCLRQRKCRPDRESIAVFVMRKRGGGSLNEIFSEIENIVDQGALLKVEYKGSTSYRSPKSFDLKNSPLLTKHSKILNSSKTTRYVISGMNELLSTFPNYSQEGIPFEDLKKKLQGFDEERFAEAGIKVIFEREEAAGSIQPAQSDDPVTPIRIFPKDIQVPSGMKTISFMEEANPQPENKKRKKVKKPKDDVDASELPETVTPTRKITKRKKEEIVYAVKSTPEKIEETEDGALKEKAEQISNISLKVITGKGKTQKGKAKVESTIDKAQLNEMIDIKPPSLGLVAHEIVIADSVDKTPAVNGNGKQNNNATPTPTGSSKKLTVSANPRKRSRPTKDKKEKVETHAFDNDSDEQLRVTHMPPRYTYSAKRRVRTYDHVMKTEPMSSDEDETLGTENGHSEICAYCRNEENSAGHPEDFLSCGSCNAKIHPTCIDYSEDHAKRLRLNSTLNLPWQCFSCKRCGVCEKALMSSNNSLGNRKLSPERNSKRKEERYVLCDRCDRGYHANCIDRSPPTSLHEGSWYCPDCEEVCSRVDNGSVKPDNKPVSPKKSAATQTAGKKGTTRKKGVTSKPEDDKSTNNSNSIERNGTHSSRTDSCGAVSSTDSEIPDISGWTTDQVQTYFTEKGLKEEASSLREQEIDGMSLLLLRRADVIFGLNLRLGPALKIHRLVCQLQQHASALKKNDG